MRVLNKWFIKVLGQGHIMIRNTPYNCIFETAVIYTSLRDVLQQKLESLIASLTKG